MKQFILLSLALLFSSVSFAGGFVTNVNQHASYLRNIVREATTEIDAAYSNPAGLAFMKEGFQFSINEQVAIQSRTIRSTYSLFNYNGGSDTKSFKGKTFAPIIPSIQAAYKTGDWTFSAHMAVIGGGGKCTFEDGLPSFESNFAMLPAAISAMGVTTKQYDLDCWVRGEQYIFGVQVGATYQLCDNFSAFLGGRVSYALNKYEGYVHDIKVNPEYPLINPTGEMMSASDFFTAVNQSIYATMTKDIELDCKQTGTGFMPIIGLGYHKDKLTVGVKYEFKTHIMLENDTKENGSGIEAYNDGVETHYDIPALLTVGAEYQVLPKLKAMVSYRNYFDKKAIMPGNKQDFINKGTREYSLGLEYNITDKILFSISAQRTKYDVEDGFQSDLSFSCSSYSYGTGFQFTLTEKMKLNVGYFVTDYEDYTKKSDNYNKSVAEVLGNTIEGTDVYSRKNQTIGVGINYAF